MDFTTGALATRSAARLSDANAARRVPSANARALLMNRPAFESSFRVPMSLRDESNQLLKAVAKTRPRATHRRPARLQLQRVAVTTHSVPIMPPGLQFDLK